MYIIEESEVKVPPEEVDQMKLFEFEVGKDPLLE